MKNFKKFFATALLLTTVTVTSTFASGGILVAGATDNPSPCVEKEGILVAGRDGILVAGRDGILVAGFTGILVAGLTGILVAGAADEPSQDTCGILVAG